jgi:hypothetical protein
MFFTSAGAEVCKRCHFAAQTSEMEGRARESAAAAGMVAVPGAEPDSPAKMMWKGGIVFGAGVAWMVGGLVYLETFYFYPLALLGVGFVMFARGFHLRPRR